MQTTSGLMFLASFWYPATAYKYSLSCVAHLNCRKGSGTGGVKLYWRNSSRNYKQRVCGNNQAVIKIGVNGELRLYLCWW